MNAKLDLLDVNLSDAALNEDKEEILGTFLQNVDGVFCSKVWLSTDYKIGAQALGNCIGINIHSFKLVPHNIPYNYQGFLVCINS